MDDIKADLYQLKEDIAYEIKVTKANRQNDRSKSTFISLYSGLISALTTFCIGLNPYVSGKYTAYLTGFSLFISASLTFVLAWNKLFNHKSLWINSAIKLSELYELNTDIRHSESSKSIDQNLLNNFYKRYKTIMNDANIRWLKIRE
ncbi:SLATT domain-containing protein [Acinetobacter oleivorans]|uniref:SLATT domain-containing protein n=1 Tax=Acinetobacter oleivorans TaxID=1148157 RepID=UPI0011A5435C|nr:SLATT domain-containing protein [Acinetobacter oleivorans]